jgi:dTDP-4-dehydrorhamnose 3,5-epimerase
MKITRLEIPDAILIEPTVFKDNRGFFFESFNAREFESLTGVKTNFVQDNHSKSQKNVVRGLHYQLHQGQNKLVRVTAGEIFDVAVDLRRKSPTFGRWVGARLSAENFRQLFVPLGFAHGFVVLSETAEVLYKTSDFYAPADEHCLRWDDPALSITWPFDKDSALVSDKDAKGLTLANAKVFDR